VFSVLTLDTHARVMCFQFRCPSIPQKSCTYLFCPLGGALSQWTAQRLWLHLPCAAFSRALTCWLVDRTLWQVCVRAAWGKQERHGKRAQLHFLPCASHREEPAGYHAHCKCPPLRSRNQKSFQISSQWRHVTLSSLVSRISCVAVIPRWRMNWWPSWLSSPSSARRPTPRWHCEPGRLDVNFNFFWQIYWACFKSTISIWLILKWLKLLFVRFSCSDGINCFIHEVRWESPHQMSLSTPFLF